MPLAKGTRLGPYEIDDLLGRGGMGDVYRARDTRIGRPVAIKVVGESRSVKGSLTERFAREARILATINDPHIAVLYEFESSGGHDFAVMELVEGETLAERLRKKRLGACDVLPLFVQIATGLKAAHNRGIVHRDLKPANIMITPDDTAKILDFGLSKETVDFEQPDVDPGDAPTRDVELSRDGQIMGTPPYMSPEQVRGQDIDKRTDVWAFGCVLYEALAGQRAFAGGSFGETMSSILSAEPDWSLLPDDTPGSVRRLLRRCLCRDRRQRLQDIGDARIELMESLADAGQTHHSDAVIDSRPARAGLGRGFVTVAISLAVMASVLALAVAFRPSVKPHVLLMDSKFPVHAYDPQTQREGLSNANDLTEALRELPITTNVEPIAPTWSREREVIEQRPALIVIHRSGFVKNYDPAIWDTLNTEEARDLFNREVYEPGWEKLVIFLGTVSASCPNTKFVVYSRNWLAEGDKGQRLWKHRAEKRFPSLRKRVYTLNIPAIKGVASFRDRETAMLVVRKVSEALGIEVLATADSER